MHWYSKFAHLIIAGLKTSSDYSSQLWGITVCGCRATRFIFQIDLDSWQSAYLDLVSAEFPLSRLLHDCGRSWCPPFTYSFLHLPLNVSKNTLPSLSFSYDNSQLCINSSVWPFKEEWHGIQWRRLSGNIYQMVTIESLMHVLVPVVSLTLPTLLLSNPGSKWITTTWRYIILLLPTLDSCWNKAGPLLTSESHQTV